MVKKLSILIAFITVVYIMYYDIKVGTLPISTPVSAQPQNTQSEKTLPKKTIDNPSVPFKEIEIKSGDTLLTIVEQLNNHKKLPSFTQLKKDFDTLNPNVSPTKLQIGKTYKFPTYE